ncbi:aryl-sulfate sulfotransferase [candidate division KSB1 bacterium]|nr:aryl-sulfate sulfotransferase [candidate division KSB1 bacterium]
MVRLINGVAVPSDFPEINVHEYSTSTSPGKIFFGSTFTNSAYGNYLVICENDGTPCYYRKFQKKGDSRGSGEFQLQPTGLLTAYLFEPEFYIALDRSFSIVDTFRCGNGYATDAHELTLLPNGHALLIANEYRTVDMSQLVDGGHTRATVLGNHVQELDEHKNVVFEWKCWDHYNIADAIHENLRAASIDYMHMNSVVTDFDGHLIVSIRHLSEITKINRQTGDIMWRFGGVHNQFTFINDEYEFSYQHYARPVPGKPHSYTFFDNGNHRHPQFSRAIEFKLDTARMTAEKTWEFRYTPDRYISMLGSVQRFANNNTMINWSTWPPLFANEVDYAGNILYEIQVGGVSSNRVRRYEWEGVAKAPYLLGENRNDGVVLIFNKFGDRQVKEYVVFGGSRTDNLIPMDTTANTYSHLTKLENNTTYYFRVCAIDSYGIQSEFSDVIELLVKIRQPGANLLVNGDFTNGDTGWTFLSRDEANAVGGVRNGAYAIDFDTGGSELWKVQLVQENVPLVQGHTYRFEFDAWADARRVIEAKIAQNNDQWINYSRTTPIEIVRAPQHYTFDFKMTNPGDTQARVVFNCGLSEVNCYIDNVSLKLLEESLVRDVQQLPVVCQLSQNYPNPFNAATVIPYQLAEECHVRLSVYDLLGRRLAECIWRHRPAGSYAHSFETSGWNSGVYVYQLDAIAVGHQVTNSHRKKMVLIK